MVWTRDTTSLNINWHPLENLMYFNICWLHQGQQYFIGRYLVYIWISLVSQNWFSGGIGFESEVCMDETTRPEDNTKLASMHPSSMDHNSIPLRTLEVHLTLYTSPLSSKAYMHINTNLDLHDHYNNNNAIDFQIKCTNFKNCGIIGYFINHTNYH